MRLTVSPIVLFALVAACGSKAPSAVDVPPPAGTAAVAAPDATAPVAGDDAAAPIAEDATAPVAAEDTGVPVAAEDAAAPVAAEDAAAPVAAEDATAPVAVEDTAAPTASEDVADPTAAADATAAPPADLPVVKGVAPAVVARLVQGAPGCVGVAKSGRAVLVLVEGEGGKELRLFTREGAEMVEAAEPTPVTDARAFAASPEFAEAYAGLGLVGCQTTPGPTATVPKAVPIEVTSREYEVEVRVAGNHPVVLPARYEYGSFAARAIYWSPDLGPIFVHLAAGSADGPPDKVVRVDAASLGDSECVPRPVGGAPYSPKDLPGPNLSRPTEACAAMTADGAKAALKVWSSDTAPDGHDASQPPSVTWFGAGEDPGLDLGCTVRGCKGDQGRFAGEVAMKLGLIACPAVKGHITIDGREAAIASKDGAIRLKGGSGWRTIHTLRSGFDGEGHEQLWQMFQHPAGGPLFIYVGNEDTGVSEALVYVLDEAAMKLCPAAPAGTLAVAEVKASSSAKDGGGYAFGPAQLADGDLTTSWQPGGDDPAPSVELVLAAEAEVRAVDIANGFQRRDGNGDLFALNARVATATLTFSDGSTEKVTLAPDKRDFVTFEFAPRKTTSVKVSIDARHDGARWPKDVALSEIRLRGAPPAP